MGGRRLLVGTSFLGTRVPTAAVIRASHFVLLHGNGVADPDGIVKMVAAARSTPGYTPKLILFNEDDREGFDEGYQSVPVN